MIIRRIGVLSSAKTIGAIYAAFGLLAGVAFALFSLLGAAAALGRDQPATAIGALFGVGAIVFVPLLYGVIGVIVGAIGALLYNVTAGFAGGIELEVEVTDRPSPDIPPPCTPPA